MPQDIPSREQFRNAYWRQTLSRQGATRPESPVGVTPEDEGLLDLIRYIDTHENRDPATQPMSQAWQELMWNRGLNAQDYRMRPGLYERAFYGPNYAQDVNLPNEDDTRLFPGLRLRGRLGDLVSPRGR